MKNLETSKNVQKPSTHEGFLGYGPLSCVTVLIWWQGNAEGGQCIAILLQWHFYTNIQTNVSVIDIMKMLNNRLVLCN